METVEPESVASLQEAVRSLERVVVRGGGTKTAMSAGANVSLAKLTGVLEYTPAEYTITARAGTRLLEVQEQLDENGQYLPFDPVFVAAGGTLGGTIASGLSGPGRFRYGGVRDFLLGVRMVTGSGDVHAGGGKVVKNAAGFDFPKLMVGARGRFGIVVEATFKVFPRPKAFATILCDGFDALSASTMMQRLAGSSFELACLDYSPPGRLLLRIGGLEDSLDRRIERASSFLERSVEVLRGDADEAVWREAREFSWQEENATLVKVAIAPGQVADVERAMEEVDGTVGRRYSVGGNVLWLAWPTEMGHARLQSLLSSIGRAGVAVRGAAWDVIGGGGLGAFGERVASVLDPAGRFRKTDVAAVR